MTLPYVIEGTDDREKVYDVYSRMLKDRIVFIRGEFNDAMADSVVAQLLFLESQDPDKDINIYINSPGGSISSAFAIYDAMNYIRPDIRTVGYGSCCSAASFILSAGTKGKRVALPNTEIMIHELSSGAKGKYHDIKVDFEHMTHIHNKLAEYYSKFTGKSVRSLKKYMETDRWMNADEAKEFGIIDIVEESRS